MLFDHRFNGHNPKFCVKWQLRWFLRKKYRYIGIYNFVKKRDDWEFHLGQRLVASGQQQEVVRGCYSLPYICILAKHKINANYVIQNENHSVLTLAWRDKMFFKDWGWLEFVMMTYWTNWKELLLFIILCKIYIDN